MSILERIRSKSGLTIVVIGGALLLFVVSDALNSNTGLFGGRGAANEVGEINGEKISYKLFEQRVNENADMYKQQMGPEANLDQNTMSRLREDAWNNLLQDNLMAKEYSDLGISVTNEELFDIIQGEDPHPQIRQAPIFQNAQTGQFDRTLVLRFLKNMESSTDETAKKQWLTFEDGLVKEAMGKKYMALFQKGVYATSLEAKDKYADRMRTADFDMVALNYFSIADSTIKAEESDLKAYFNKNSDKYKQKENSRKLEYVLFDATPTGEDSAEIRKWVSDQVQQFAAADNDTTYVDANSETKFDPTPKSRKEYPKDVVDRLFSDSVGAVVGPVFANGKYSIYKIAGVTQDSVWQMRASHILFRIDNGDTAAAMKKAQDVLAEIRKGSDFAQMAAIHGTDGTSQTGGDLGWFKEKEMVKEFNDAVLAGKKGDMKILTTQFGVHILKITADKSKKLVTAGVVDRTIEPSEKTMSTAYNAASQFAAISQTQEDFEKNISEKNYTKRTVETVRENDRSIAGVEDARELVMWANTAKKGDVSDVKAIGDKYIVAIVTAIREKGKAIFEDSKNLVESDYRKEKKGEMLMEKAKTAMTGAATLQDIAAKLQVAVSPVTGQTFESSNIAYVGPDNTFVGTLFGTKTTGKISGPVVGDNAVYIYNITKFNEPPAATDLQPYKMEIMAQLGQRIGYGSFDALKEIKHVVDNRYKFY